MPSSDDDSAQGGIEALTDAVKSRILDRILADLREKVALGPRGSGYTKSDSGLYGKYQKADVDLGAILQAISGQIDAMVEQYQDSNPEPTDSNKSTKAGE